MKKICVLMFVLILLLSTFSFKLAFGESQNNKNLIYTFYTIGDCSDLKDAQIIKNGNSNIVRTTGKRARDVREKLSNVLGESVSFEGDLLKLSRIKDYLNICYIIDETIEDEIIVFSGYSEKKKNDLKTLSVNGKKINFQIAYNKGTITIGTPVILGDY